MKRNLFLQPEDIIPDLAAEKKEDILKEMAALAVDRHPGLSAAEVLKVLQERERLGSTGIGDGIAIPHGKLKQAKDVIAVFGRSVKGVEFNSLDGRKVHLLFLLLAPEDAVGIHLKMLARISRLLKDPSVRTRLLSAPDAEAISTIIREQDSRF